MDQPWWRREPQLASPRAELIAWAILLVACAAIWFVCWRNGYWIWRGSPVLVGLILNFSSFAFCLLPVAVIFGFFCRQRREFPSVVRTIQVLLPVVAFVLGMLLMDVQGPRQTDFNEHRHARVAIVEMHRTSRPAEKEDRTWREEAPKELAAEERIWVSRDGGDYMVFFPVHLEGIDNYRGFVYSDSGKEPTKGSFLHVVSSERIDEHWFWIRTT